MSVHVSDAQWMHNGKIIPDAGKSTRNGIGSGAIIAIAAVGGIVILVLATICFCCCRSRWRNRASAIEAATLAKAQPKPEPMTPTGPAPFAVNYPQFQVQPFTPVDILVPSPPPPSSPNCRQCILKLSRVFNKYSSSTCKFTIGCKYCPPPPPLFLPSGPYQLARCRSGCMYAFSKIVWFMFVCIQCLPPLCSHIRFCPAAEILQQTTDDTSNAEIFQANIQPHKLSGHSIAGSYHLLFDPAWPV